MLWNSIFILPTNRFLHALSVTLVVIVIPKKLLPQSLNICTTLILQQKIQGSAYDTNEAENKCSPISTPFSFGTYSHHMLSPTFVVVFFGFLVFFFF